MYGKIFRQIYNSSIADNWKVRVVFMDLIILSDPDGVVDMTLESISRITNVPLDMVREAIENLQLPDPQSRSIEEEGRRLVKISNDRTWGWRIVNYGRYRNTHTEFDRRSNNHYGDTTKRNYVYYAVSGSQVKIGTSQNPWSRVKEMKTVRPSIHLLAVEDGGHDVEYERHRQFKQYSTDREWFRYEGELKEFVLKLKGVREKDKLRNPDSSANSSEIVVYPSSSPSACSYREGGTGGNNGLESFDAFWKAYPKKSALFEAQRAFVEVNAKAVITDILAAVEKQKKWDSWTRDNGQYIPSPANWLRDGRWRDKQPEQQYRSPL